MTDQIHKSEITGQPLVNLLGYLDKLSTLYNINDQLNSFTNSEQVKVVIKLCKPNIDKQIQDTWDEMFEYMADRLGEKSWNISTEVIQGLTSFKKYYAKKNAV